jgi:hypothetical protein
MKRAKLNPRKLLIASIGVATVDYLVACNGLTSVANLMAPPDGDGYGGSVTIANLMPAPPAQGGYGGNATVANLMPAPPGVANLVAPPPYVDPRQDAGRDPVDAADEVDAGRALDAGAVDAG